MTFLDDPLRVLRAVRFASRFDLQLDASLRASVELDEVKVLTHFKLYIHTPV